MTEHDKYRPSPTYRPPEKYIYRTAMEQRAEAWRWRKEALWWVCVWVAFGVWFASCLFFLTALPKPY